MVQLAGFVLLALGAFMFVRSLMTVKAIDRDEFNRRSSGGVLQYETYEDSVRARNLKGRNGCFGQFGVVLALIGGFLAFGMGPVIDKGRREARAEQSLAENMRKCANGDDKVCEDICFKHEIAEACHAVGLQTRQEALKRLER